MTEPGRLVYWAKIYPVTKVISNSLIVETTNRSSADSQPIAARSPVLLVVCSFL
jgi:hypothetical protein